MVALKQGSVPDVIANKLDHLLILTSGTEQYLITCTNKKYKFLLTTTLTISAKRMQQAKVCPYLLRNAVIDAPNQAWSIDITYIPIRHGFLYLTAVIDWYSRCIVGWEVDDTLDTRMVINALKKAFVVAKPQILNSDQGCQFTSQQYIDFVRENGIRQSMDGKSRWADNIMIERWFRSFKYEEAYLTQYNNIKEARTAIGRYIHTYNFERCHSALDYKTPAECYYPAMLLPYVA
ncbi:MAG: IS3 family transposase [Lachnospiraceae bacterium]